ncbi:PX domain-containing protein kinase-like protein isoform X1 [Mytilus edulis]
MAVFEKKLSQKLSIDDTVALTCVIEAAQKSADHMVYSVRIQYGPKPENSWTLQKRYSDFVALDTELKIANIDVQLPPKKVFGNFDREFVAERQQGLQKYIDTILGHPLLANSQAVKKFLSPDNYTINQTEIALQHVSMVFRSENKWDVIESLPDIGWRLRKEYILVKPIDQPKIKEILTWCDYGPDKFMPEKELAAVLRIFPSIQHPNIYPVTFATANESGGLLIQSFCEKGTLRDLICKCKPKIHYLKKYGNPKSYSILEPVAIKTFGKQILLTLKYLQEKCIPYGHLHAGNIIVEGQVCKFLDLQNWFLGLPSYYRPFFVQFKKIQTTESIDVYCFGQLLYEMTFGSQLYAATCDNFPPSCPPQIRSVLESILTSEACKNGLPTVADLLSHPLFSDITLPLMDKPILKIPSKLKEFIRTAKDDVEKRLHDEQKVIHKIKRMSKAKEFHMSEEEKKRRRKSKKKAMENGQPESSSTAVTSSENPTSPVSPTTPAAPAPPAAPPAPPAPPPPGAPPPPPPPPGAPAPPPPPPPTSGPAAPPPPASNERGALLGSIQNFSKGGLKKAVTVDKSAPKV